MLKQPCGGEAEEMSEVVFFFGRHVATVEVVGLKDGLVFKDEWC